MAEERLQRRLAAILAADVVGYSALMERAEEATYARIAKLRQNITEPSLTRHQGRLIKTTGDGLLAEFASPTTAVRCAVEIQRQLAIGTDSLQLRIGINLGDVIVEDGGDIYGEGINIAARLESMAEPGGILVSGKVHDEVEGKLDVGFEDRGERQLKNILKPVRVYAVIGQGSGAVAAGPSAPAAPLPLPERPSIAILPFHNMSDDPEQEYFADGMVEDITTALSRLRGFFVIARNSSFAYKGRSPDIRQVGRELGVRYVLEGSVRKSGNRVRITAQLIDALNSSHLWAERYDRDLADIFTLQDEITESVVGSIEPQLLLAEDIRLKQKPPANLDAWGCVTRALSHYAEFSQQGFRAAQRFLEQAIERDPGYARALALLAHVRGIMAFSGWEEREDEVFAAALDIARKAVSLDRDDPWVHMALGGLAVQMRRHEESIASLKRAVELNPNFALAHSNLGRALAAVGRVDEAIEHTTRALRISPRDPQKHLFLVRHGTVHFAAGRYRAAAEFYQQAINERPEFINAWRVLVAASALSGDVGRASAALSQLRQLQPGVSLAWIERHSEMGDALRGRLIEGLRQAGLE